METIDDKSTLTYPGSFMLFVLASVVWLVIIHTAYFGIVAYKASRFEGKECEVVNFAGATIPIEADERTEPCADQLWRNATFKAIVELMVGAIFWITFVLVFGALWKLVHEDYLSRRLWLSVALALTLAPVIPAVLHCVLLFRGFTLEHTLSKTWP